MSCVTSSEMMSMTCRLGFWGGDMILGNRGVWNICGKVNGRIAVIRYEQGRGGRKGIKSSKPELSSHQRDSLPASGELCS